MAQGIADALRELADAIGDFSADVRQAMRERESELRRATGLDGPAAVEAPHTPRHAE